MSSFRSNTLITQLPRITVRRSEEVATTSLDFTRNVCTGFERKKSTSITTYTRTQITYMNSSTCSSITRGKKRATEQYYIYYVTICASTIIRQRKVTSAPRKQKKIRTQFYTGQTCTFYLLHVHIGLIAPAPVEIAPRFFTAQPFSLAFPRRFRHFSFLGRR